MRRREVQNGRGQCGLFELCGGYIPAVYGEVFAIRLPDVSGGLNVVVVSRPASLSRALASYADLVIDVPEFEFAA
jgi:hypothetical protein